MSSNPMRIPFAEAVAEPRLMKTWWEKELSPPQRTALKIFYGLHLSNQPIWRGWSELDLWSASQGSATYDDVGHLVCVPIQVPYTPKEYSEAWAIWGVRSGKSAGFAATIAVYEAVAGGHEAYFRAGRQAICFQVCQDLRLARYSLHGIRTVLDTIPFLSSPYQGGPRIRNVTADKVELWNGLVLATTPPTVKSVRGYDAPVCVLDEVGVWYTEQDSANPDTEVYRAVSSRQAQFSDPKIVGISSPWGRTGMLYERFLAGTEGRKLSCGVHEQHVKGCEACEKMSAPHRNRVVLHAPTAAVGNPLVKQAWLEAEQGKDPKAFERECLAVFQDSISGFLDSKRLGEAVEKGVYERPYVKENLYVAAMDPGFKRDAFAFGIAHADPVKGIVVDVLRRFVRDPKGNPLNPETLFREELAPLLKIYKIATVECDQYHFESLLQLALQQNFSLSYTPFSATTKAALYGNLKALVNQGRVKLLDHAETVKELGQLELMLGSQGNAQIAAPRGAHDDMATVVALLCHHATWMLPMVAAPTKVEGGRMKTLSIHETCLRQATSRQIQAQAGWEE
jgi:hypothetical protein